MHPARYASDGNDQDGEFDGELGSESDETDGAEDEDTIEEIAP